jgi:hypothetical protein
MACSNYSPRAQQESCTLKANAASLPIPGEAACHSGMMPPTDSEMMSPTIPG